MVRFQEGRFRLDGKGGQTFGQVFPGSSGIAMPGK